MIWKKKFEIYDSFYHFRLRPEVTVDVLNPIVFAYIERSIFGISFISLWFTVSEKKGGQDDFLKNVNRPYLTTGSEFWKNEKKRLGVFLFSIISENFKKIHRSISEKSAKQKKGKKRKNNNNNNKQYNLYKVFRLKRKTLIKEEKKHKNH